MPRKASGPKLTNAERMRRRREADPERWYAEQRRRYHENIEKSRKQRTDWYARNKERLIDHWRVSWHANNLRRRKAPGKISASALAEILELQRHRCAACRRSVRGSYHIDHIIPIARGGTNDRRNIQILCPTCNLSKGAKDPATFMRSRGFLL